jgi:hypothetical protein
LGKVLPPLPTLVIFFFALAALIVFSVTMTWVWTPVEVVTIRDGDVRSRFVAHVVNEEGEWTTLLTADSRMVVRVPSHDVVHRQTCHYSAQPRGRRPLVYVILRRNYSSPNRKCETYCENVDAAIPALATDPSMPLKRCRW